MIACINSILNELFSPRNTDCYFPDMMRRNGETPYLPPSALDLLLLPRLVLPVGGLQHLVEVAGQGGVHAAAAVVPRQLVLERLQLQLVEPLQRLQGLVGLDYQVGRGGREAGPKVPQHLQQIGQISCLKSSNYVAGCLQIASKSLFSEKKNCMPDFEP